MGSSQNLLQLIPAAIEVLKVAFRVGVRVTEIRGQIEQEPNHAPSWSVVVSGIGNSDATDLINSFNDENVSPYILQLPSIFVTCFSNSIILGRFLLRLVISSKLFANSSIYVST